MRSVLQKTMFFIGNNTKYAAANYNFHALEVVSRYREPQLQVRENYSYLFNVRPNIRKT